MASLSASAWAGGEADADLKGETFWDVVRQKFLFTEKKVPLNAANLCPSSRAVSDLVAALTRDVDTDCSFQNRAKFRQTLETSRRKVAAHVGAEADEIALVRNTSEANNTIVNGLRLGSGDEVVIWNQNHPTNKLAWEYRARRDGLTVTSVRTPARPGGADELVAAFAKALTGRTRVLAITHLSNTTGVRLPVARLCELARRRGIYVHVDGAQSWGALELDLPKMGCDSFSGSAHKWPAGPKETGLLYVRAENVERIWPSTVALGGKFEPTSRAVGARKFETLGQRDDAALAALGLAIDLQTSIGTSRVQRRITQLATLLKGSLKESGFRLVTPLEPELSGGVSIIEVPGSRRGAVTSRLYEQAGIAAAGTGGLRLSPHIYNTRAHVERAIKAIQGMRKLILG